MLSGSILITGGSGTLGHAIVRTAEAEKWDCTFTIYSRSELRQAQMRSEYPYLRYVLGDVRDYDRLAAAVAGHDLVIHAAAMKRIPECEIAPAECYQTNVIGSANVVRACMAGNVKRCIGISTDKACRAVTAYGASKLAMEKLFQAQQGRVTTFTLVRYGNVVASNGSVIPIWRQQAKAGAALTMTDPKMTRFWMGESDAVKLIERAETRQPGTITIPKMYSLSLSDMAHIIAPEAQFHITGLRSVEKQHEDLLHTDEAAIEDDTHYYLTPDGWAGKSYTSYNAPRLAPSEFRRMLIEAESHD